MSSALIHSSELVRSCLDAKPWCFLMQLRFESGGLSRLRFCLGCEPGASILGEARHVSYHSGQLVEEEL
jgi:hypothetical protein